VTFPATTWTPETLAPLLGGGRGTSAADSLEQVERFLTTAVELLEDACTVTFRTIPESVADEMVLRTVRALWDARKTASGQQFTENGAPAAPRAPRDPLAAAEALLGRYVVPL
jgi:hypothetical protein